MIKLIQLEKKNNIQVKVPLNQCIEEGLIFDVGSELYYIDGDTCEFVFEGKITEIKYSLDTTIAIIYYINTKDIKVKASPNYFSSYYVMVNLYKSIAHGELFYYRILDNIKEASTDMVNYCASLNNIVKQGPYTTESVGKMVSRGFDAGVNAIFAQYPTNRPVDSGKIMIMKKQFLKQNNIYLGKRSII